MRVRATRAGYYQGAYRYPGDVFTLSDPKHFSDAHRRGKGVHRGWMERVDEAPASPAKPAKPAAEPKKKPAAPTGDAAVI